MIERKTLTQHIKIPVLTNVEELLGNYHNLFVARGIESNLAFASNGNFTHPIPESYQKLLHDFMHINNLLNGFAMSYEKIKLENVQVHQTGEMATFFFSMQEKTDHVFLTNV